MKLNEQITSARILTADDVSATFEIENRSYSNSNNIFGCKQINSIKKFSLKKKIGSFPRSARNELFKSPETPGPGHYEIFNTKVSPSYSFIGKSRETIRLNPGPGAYTPNLLESKKGITIAKSQRSEFYSVENTPGPGHYEKLQRPSTPSWIFSKDHEKRQYISTPGPGSYESKVLPKGVEHSTTKSARKNLFRIGFTPGPGTYESNTIIPSYKLRYASHNLGLRQKAANKIP